MKSCTYRGFGGSVWDVGSSKGGSVWELLVGQFGIRWVTLGCFGGSLWDAVGRFGVDNFFLWVSLGAFSGSVWGAVGDFGMFRWVALGCGGSSWDASAIESPKLVCSPPAPALGVSLLCLSPLLPTLR